MLLFCSQLCVQIWLLQLSLIAGLRTDVGGVRGRAVWAAGTEEVKYCCQEVVENQAKRNDLARADCPPTPHLFLPLSDLRAVDRKPAAAVAVAGAGAGTGRGVLKQLLREARGVARLISIFCWRLLAFIICMFFPSFLLFFILIIYAVALVGCKSFDNTQNLLTESAKKWAQRVNTQGCLCQTVCVRKLCK